MNSVVMVGYWYAPSPGAAAQRMSAFARHLPTFDWTTQVVAAGRPDANDPAGVLRVPDIGPTAIASFADYAWPPPPSRSWKPRGWLYPDRFFFWRRRAFRAVVTGCLRPSVVFASFPPASAAVLGAQLAHAWGVPLVLEMRDLWFGPGGYSPPTPLYHWLHARLERRTARAASRIIAVSDAMADHLAERFALPRDRVHTVPNGFEPTEAAASDADRSSTAGFRIVHAGTVIPRNRPDLFFEAVAESPQAARWLEEQLHFRFVGNLSPATTQHSSLAGLVETTGMVDADTARHEMRQADALLLLVGDYVGRWGHNAKLFDYIAANRPILCLEESPGSNDRRLLEKVAPQRCIFAELSDRAAVAQAVDAIRHRASTFTLTNRAAIGGLEPYYRKSTAKQLAAILTLAGSGSRQM